MNTKKRGNVIESRLFFQWILVAFSLGGIGLQIVHLKNEQFQLGQNIWQLENTIRNVQIRNQVLIAEIATLSSRATIQKKLESMAIVMYTIQDRCIARLLIQQVSSNDDVRTACHERPHQ